MVTRGECFWVACNRLIISFFCVYVVREGKKVVSDGSRVCHRCIVLLLFVECMDLWQLVSTQLLYRGGTPLYKASSIYLTVLIPSSIWRC